jgi:hypothetical protein
MEATPIEERRLALEERRVLCEEDKARQEIKWGWITRLGVAIPLVVLAATLIYNGWQFRREAENNREQENRQAQREAEIEEFSAKIQFQLAILDTLLSQESPQEAHSKAVIFDELGISEDIGDEKLAPIMERVLDQDAGSKEAFINLLVAHPDKQKEIVALWHFLFSADEWVSALR